MVILVGDMTCFLMSFFYSAMLCHVTGMLKEEQNVLSIQPHVRRHYVVDYFTHAASFLVA